MSGHNKWSKIKHKKEASDAQKSKVFSKLVKLIQNESKASGGNTESPNLKTAIEKAKRANMPSDNIERAIKKGTTDNIVMEEVTYEAYGPGGTAMIITGLSSNRNKTAQEVRHALTKNGLSLAENGSASWAFKKVGADYEPQTMIKISDEDADKLETVIDELDDLEDVQDIFTNAE
ncbi:YebC/PmpR family DNA-binding transcriptional regulator [Candidatus Parcubacteria bacterium]|nr:YebC/PmpR family DNA-binding transcriptional regulator [Candidatus Parcubacteria bacterium]